MAILVQSNKKPSVSFPSQAGSIVTFDSPFAGLPLKACKVNIPVTQEGTGDPSPDNVRNFVGVDSLDFSATGLNLLDLADKTTTGPSYIANKILCFLKAGTYSFSLNFSGATNSGFIAFYDENDNEIYNSNFYTAVGVNTKKVELPSTAYKFTFYSNAVGVFTNFQIELGSTASSFEAYNGEKKLFTFGQTIYVGELDVLTGTLTIKYQMYSGGWTQYKQNNGFKAYRSNVMFASYDRFDGKSNMLRQFGSFSSDNMTMNICQLPTGENIAYLALDEDVDVNDFQLVYRLPTTTTIQLPPFPIETLQGENNLFASTGETTVSHIKIGG